MKTITSETGCAKLVLDYVETLKTYRAAVCENKKKYVQDGDLKAIRAANAQLRSIDSKLTELGYPVI